MKHISSTIALSMLLMTMFFGAMAALTARAGVVQEEGALTFFEDFQDDTLLGPPSEDWYTFSKSGTGTGIIRESNGIKVYRQTSTTGFVSTWDHSTTGIVFDRGDPQMTGARIKVQPTSQGAWADQRFGWCRSACGDGSLYLSVNAAGDVTITVDWGGNQGGASYLVAGPTGVPSTEPLEVWLFDTSCILTVESFLGECDGRSGGSSLTVRVIGTFYFPAYDFVISVDTSRSVSGCGACTNNQVWGPPPNFQIANGDLEMTYFALTNIALESAPPIGASATTTALELVGFDVDRGGNNIIARTGGGTSVQAFNAFSLFEVGTASTPNCSRFDGVSALSTHIAYVDCATDGLVDSIKVRSPTLGAPDVPDGCGQECPQDIEETSNINVPSELKQLAILDLYLFQPENFNSGSIAFTFSTFDGKVGVTGITYNNLGSDYSDTKVVAYDTTSNPDVTSFCAWRASNGADLLGAVTPNGASKWYEARVDIQGAGIAERKPSSTLIGPILSNTGALGGAFGIDCAGSRAIVQNNQGVWIVNVGGEAVPFIERGPLPVAQPTPRGVAISANGEFVAWLDGSTVKIASAATGNVSGIITHPNPAGHRGLAMDSTAQNLWIATSSAITRYEVYTATTGEPVAGTATDQFGRPIDGTTSGTTGSGTSGGPVATIISRWGSTTRFVVGLVLVAISAGIAYRLAGPAPMIVGGAATLGMCAAVVVVGFPLWIPVTIAAGGLGTFAAMIAKRVGGSKA